jgi:hypothetical protein
MGISLYDEMNAAVREREKALGRKLTRGEEYALCYDIELDRELAVHGIPIRVSAAYALANANHPYFAEYAPCPTCGDYFGKRFLEPHRQKDHQSLSEQPGKDAEALARVQKEPGFQAQSHARPDASSASGRRRRAAVNFGRVPPIARKEKSLKEWVRDHQGDWIAWFIIALLLAAALFGR